MNSVIDPPPAFIWPWCRPCVPSLLPVGFRWVGGATCLPSAVPELRTSTLKQTVFCLTRLWSRPLVFGTSFSCLPSLWSQLRLRPAPSPLLSPENLNYILPVDRHRWSRIEQHRS